MIKNNKKIKISTTALILILTFSAILVVLPIAIAQDQPTVPFIALRPNPVGVGQTVLLMGWLQPTPPTKDRPGAAGAGLAGIKYEQMILEITKPDGNVDTLGPYTSDPLGIVWQGYVPDIAGTYQVKMIFPGQYITGYNYYTGFLYDNTWFEPATSPTIDLVVQLDPVAELAATPLPGSNDYWERPIQGDNKDWGSIAGNWLMRGYNSSKASIFDSGGGWNPYTTSPNSAHVLWTREIKMGGLIGGDYGAYAYYSGLSYECAVTPPIILNGRLYYNIYTDRRPYLYPTGFVCVDLRTGEELWRANGTINCAQILNFISPNQMGGIPYLWATTGINKGANQWLNWTVTSPPSATTAAPWYMYDAFTGELIWTLENAMPANAPGQIVFDDHGNMMAYFINSGKGWLAAWNSTKVAGNDVWSYPDSPQWRPPMGTYDWRNGIEWNVTIPTGVGGFHEMSSGVIVTRSSDLTYNGFSMDDGTQLWGPVKKSWYSGYKASGQGIWVEANIGGYGDLGHVPDMYLYAYSLFTGQQVWKSETPSEYPWGSMRAYPLVTKDAVYDMGYDGYVHAYDTKTGKELWKYYSGDTTFETPYGHYPFYHGTPVVGGGKVFAATGEHSPTQPLISGERLHAINANTGEAVWNMSGWLTPLAVADGILVAFNAYDSRLYAFGKGQTRITAEASPTVTNLGSGIIVMGTVTDQSTGAEDSPAISDKDMSAWMEFMYRQKPRPADAVGVPVRIQIVDPAGVYAWIGTAISDSYGNYAYSFTPQMEGQYTIIATFDGSEAYYGHTTTTYFAVGPAVSPSGPITPETPASPLITTEVAVVLVAAIAAIVIIAFLVLRRRK